MPVRAFLAFVCLALLSAASAHAQITFRGSSSIGSDGNILYVGAGGGSSQNGCTPPNDTISPPTPAGLTGDLLIALVASGDSTTLAPSAGWNTLLTNNPVGNLTSKIYWRFADGSASDTLTVTKSGAGCNVMTGHMARFRRVDPANPFDTGQPIPGANCTAGGTRVKCSYQNTNSVTTGTETTVTANALLVFAVLISDSNATDASGLGFTEAFDSGTNLGNNAQVALSYRQESAAGAKGPFTVSKSGGSDPNHGVLFALRPSPSLTLAVPAGTAAGDVMVASVAVQPSSVTINTPAGWSALAATVQGAGNTSRQRFFYRVAGASEPASYTWTFSAAHTGAVGGLVSYFGADPSAPVNAFGGSATPVGGDTNLQHRAPSITTTTGNAMLISAHSFASAQTWTPPAGMTERVDDASIATPSAAGISLEINEALQPAAGASGSKVATAAGSGDNGTAQLLALKPAPFYFDIQAGDYYVACPAFPIDVSITVRDSSTGAVVTSFANLVNLSTTTAIGDWTSGVALGALNNGAANDGAATYQFVAADQGRIVLRLAVANVSTVRVRVQDSATGVTSEGADINFISDGYVFTLDPVQVAGRPQTISVVRYDNCSQSQGQGHNGNHGEKLWLALNPQHPGAATLPGATGATTVDPLPTAEPGGNNISIAFSGGAATFALTTSDVGKYLLNMRDTNSARRGTSPWITTRPFGLALRGANAASAIAHSTLPTGAVLAAAGDDFTATVAAYLWSAADDGNNDGVPDAGADITDNGLVPRYAWDTALSSGASLPSPGTTGTLSLGGASPTVPAASFSGGAATVANLRYSEVGSVLVNLLAAGFLDTPGATAAGDSGLDGTGAAGGYVGRFRPKRFALSGGTLTNRTAAACGPPSSFTYMNEGLGLAFTLTAQNTQGATTQNYTGLYARLALGTFANLGLGAKSGATDLTGRIDTGSLSSGTWASGVAGVSVSTLIRRATPDNPDGPYAGTQFGIAPVEPDGVPMQTLDLDVDGVGGNDHAAVGAATSIRFGRLRLANALGSEKLALPVPVQTQYWSGSGFITNPDDSCTRVPRSAIVLAGYIGALDPAGGNCKTFAQQDPVAFAAGVGTLTLAAPAVQGSVLLTPNLTSSASGLYCDNASSGEDPATAASLSYLLGRWNDAADPDGNANTSYDDNPAARAAFGLYGSQPGNFIYFRENY